jgi:hypothetical protein
MASSEALAARFGQERLMSNDKKLIGLQVVTGLVVSWLRRNLQYGRFRDFPWNGFEDFLVSWIAHTVGVVLVAVAAGVPIMLLHKFFLGYSPSTDKDYKDKFEELLFYSSMTMLVASVCIFYLQG